MFDLGWVEVTFLLALALIVVGPRDLPKLARGMGHLWSRARRLYRQSLQQITKLEHELEVAEGPDQRLKPSYYDLLPEHVRRAMEVSEPSRDPEHNREVEAMYAKAVDDIKSREEIPVPAELAPAQSPVELEPGNESDSDSGPGSSTSARSNPGERS